MKAVEGEILVILLQAFSIPSGEKLIFNMKLAVNGKRPFDRLSEDITVVHNKGKGLPKHAGEEEVICEPAID